jgi:hypothetical protein
LRLNHRSYLYCRGPRDAGLPPHAASAQQQTGTTSESKACIGKAGWQGGPGPGAIFRHVQAARGSSIRNVVPRPTSEVKSIEPL